MQLHGSRLDELASGRRPPLLSQPRQLLEGHHTSPNPHYVTDTYTASVNLPGVKKQAHRTCSLWIRPVGAVWPQAPSSMGDITSFDDISPQSHHASQSGALSAGTRAWESLTAARRQFDRPEEGLHHLLPHDISAFGLRRQSNALASRPSILSGLYVETTTVDVHAVQLLVARTSLAATGLQSSLWPRQYNLREHDRTLILQQQYCCIISTASIGTHLPCPPRDRATPTSAIPLLLRSPPRP